MLGAALGGSVALAVAMSFGRFAYTPVLPFMRDADGLLPPPPPAGSPRRTTSATSSAWRSGQPGRAGVPGLRPTVRAGLAVSVVTTAAMAATSTPLVWAASRLVGGVASVWAMIAVTSLVMAGVEDRRRPRDADVRRRRCRHPSCPTPRHRPVRCRLGSAAADVDRPRPDGSRRCARR